MSVKKSDKIKICIISHFGYPLYNRRCKEKFFGGGAAVQLYLLSKELANNKCLDVNVITGNHKNSQKIIELFKNIKLFNVLPLKRTPLNVFKYIVIFFLTLIRINPDVVIQRTADVSTGLCAFYCKMFKKFFIYSIANNPDVNGAAEKGILGKFFKYGIENATYIIAQNNQQIIELEKYKKKKFTNIKVVKSGYEIVEYDIKIRNHILWVSRCRPWKRPDLFLKLARKFPNEKFILICSKTSNEQYWKKIIWNASRISNMQFIDFVPFHEIDHYFKESKIFINTSIYEGFPNTFIQAFKNKTPVLSLNIDPDDILVKNKMGFYSEDNFNKMIKNLKELLQNENLLEIFGENAFRYVKNNHDIHKISKDWIQLIRKLNTIY